MRRAGLIITITAVMALPAYLSPAASSADVNCALNGVTLTVTVTEGFASTVVRNGTAIEVREGGLEDEVPCTGSPTVLSTDTVIVDDDSAPAFQTQSTIDLSGGSFAPGADGEGGSATAEIEFQLDGIEDGRIRGSGGNDNIRFGAQGANLNQGGEGGFLSDLDVTFSGLERVRVNGGDSNDTVGGQGQSLVTGAPFPLPLTLLGEAGGDQLTGGSGNDNIGLTTEPGNDTLAGGAGNDRLVAELGNDSVNGGLGSDTVEYVNSPSAVTVDLATVGSQNTGGGGTDTLGAVENLVGSLHSDTLRGNAAANVLEGHSAGDLVEGRGGQDTVLGDSSPADLGDDVLLVRDGVADTVSCLGGVDSVIADQAGVDSIPADCENVSFPPAPPPPAPPPPGPPPTGEPSNDFSFGKVKRNKRRGTAKLPVNVPGPGAIDLARTKKVKGAEERAEAGGTVRLTIKPGPKAKKKLNLTGKARVSAAVTYLPDGGEPNTDSKKVKLRKLP